MNNNIPVACQVLGNITNCTSSIFENCYLLFLTLTLTYHSMTSEAKKGSQEAVLGLKSMCSFRCTFWDCVNVSVRVTS